MEETRVTEVSENVTAVNVAEDVELIKSNITLVKKPVYDFFKRLFDIVASFFASIVLLVPTILIAGLIVLKDKGNPIYQHPRVGLNGKKMDVYKFRSMRIGADNLEEMLTKEQLEEYRKDYKLTDDPRLIGYKKSGDGENCFGAKLRKLSIDELPQIFMNILIRGNMSFVGPRPIMGKELQDNYTLDEQKLLLSVKPGLTGYWQAYARNDVGYENHERQDMELYYAENRSMILDVKILFKTIGAVLTKSGAK